MNPDSPTDTRLLEQAAALFQPKASMVGGKGGLSQYKQPRRNPGLRGGGGRLLQFLNALPLREGDLGKRMEKQDSE